MPWFTFIWNCPEPPRTFAAGSLVSVDKSTNAPVTSGNPRNDDVLDDEGSHSRTIVLRFIRHYDFPHHMPCGPVQGKQMRIIRHHEYFVGEDSDTTVRAQSRVSHQIASTRARIFPDLASCERIQRKSGIWPGYVHD